MLVKCPQCNALLEATPGESMSCKECGFTGRVAGDAKAPIHARAKEIISTPTVKRVELAAPFSFLAGVAALATFYLAEFWFPFLLAVAAIGLGAWSDMNVRRTRQTTLAIALGALALVLAIVTLVVS